MNEREPTTKPTRTANIKRAVTYCHDIQDLNFVAQMLPLNVNTTAFLQLTFCWQNRNPCCIAPRPCSLPALLQVQSIGSATGRHWGPGRTKGTKGNETHAEIWGGRLKSKSAPVVISRVQLALVTTGRCTFGRPSKWASSKQSVL